VKITDISPDQVVLWEAGPLRLNATIAVTWMLMAAMVIGAWLVTRRLSDGPHISRWQNLLEIIVDYIRKQITEISGQPAGHYLPFIGTLFLFIAVSNLLLIVPGYVAPTASLSTTTALAICVFVAVPIFGIMHKGVPAYLRQYIRPSVFMLPFNIIGEL